MSARLWYGTILLLAVAQLPQPILGADGDDWWTCSGFSAGYADAKFNGTASIPYYGEKHSAQECKAACEADHTCKAFLWSGPSPHVSPTHHDWRLRCYGRRDTTWVLTPMLDEFSGCNYQRNPKTCPDPSAQPAVTASVTVKARACLAARGKTATISAAGATGCRSTARVAAGVLLSLNQTNPHDSMVAPLRLSAHRGDWDHLPAQYSRLRALGFTTVQSLLPDLWVQNITGENSFSSLVSGRCATPGCWPGDGGNWTPWRNWVADIVSAAPTGVTFDVWNEPGTSPGYFWNRNFSQYLAMWNNGVIAAKRVRQTVKVVGPSISSFDLQFLRAFLTSANRSEPKTLPDVLSWHEFSTDGKDIPGHVDAARRLLAEFGASGTDISINEMVPMGSNFNPAVHVSFFANLERAAVDSACHSCWASACPPGAVPDAFSGLCYNCGQHDTQGVHGSMSLDGLLTSDGKELPRSVWWAYKSYSSVSGTLLVVNGSEGVDGVAALSEDGATISAVVGKLGGGGSVGGSCGPAGVDKDNSTLLRFEDVPTSVANATQPVTVAVARVINSEKASLLSISATTRSVSVLNRNIVDVKLELRNGDVALVVVGARASEVVKTFATPPRGIM